MMTIQQTRKLNKNDLPDIFGIVNESGEIWVQFIWCGQCFFSDISGEWHYIYI